MSDSISDTLQDRRKRSLWRATHRGTKEMDLMLGRFAEARLASFSACELAAFEALLERPDPDLGAELLAPAEAAATGLIAEIRRFHGLGG